MKIKNLKYLVAGCFALGLQSAFAQSSVYEELVPGSCSHMSKNPLCWESKGPAKPPRPTMCHLKASCETIKGVYQDNWGQFHCEAVSGNVFSCNNLVAVYGAQLEGFAVKVTTQYADGCHILGGCGPSACIPSYGNASLDLMCQ